MSTSSAHFTTNSMRQFVEASPVRTFHLCDFHKRNLAIGANASDTYVEFANPRRLVWKSPVVIADLIRLDHLGLAVLDL